MATRNSTPHLSRATFCLIAETIRELPSFDVRIDGAAVDCVRFSAIVARFADSLASTNPLFSRSRFERACIGNADREHG